MRALADCRRANKSARAIAGLFSAGRDDIPELAARAIEENKHLHRQRAHAGRNCCACRSRRTTGSRNHDKRARRIVTKVFDNRDAESLKQLALA